MKRDRLLDELRRGIAYGSRVLLGHCPHEWQYLSTDFSFRGPSYGQASARWSICRWCGAKRCDRR